jgi:hypothetical protein
MRECTRADDESPIPKSPSAAVSLPCISEAVPYPWNPLAPILSLGKLLSVQQRKSYCPKVAAAWWYLCNCGLLERTHEQESTQCSLLPPSWFCNWVKTTPPPQIVPSSSLLLLLYKITIEWMLPFPVQQITLRKSIPIFTTLGSLILFYFIDNKVDSSVVGRLFEFLKDCRFLFFKVCLESKDHHEVQLFQKVPQRTDGFHERADNSVCNSDHSSLMQSLSDFIPQQQPNGMRS